MVVEGAIGCAACGVSARVDKVVKHINPQTGEQVHVLDSADGCTITFGLFVGMALIDGLVMGSLTFSAFPGNTGTPIRDMIGAIFVFLTFIVPFALSCAITRKMNKTFSQALEVSSYSCTHCGKEWSR